MLDCLHIENIAVIERADIRFHEGFNVLTGETGAGKSIIIDAINAVLGERITRTMVRTGTDTAHVTALFTDLSPWTVQQLEQRGFSLDEDGNLLIGRTMSAEGKGTCTVNGRPATAALLRDIGALLVDLHGQHENQALLSPEQHLLYLDRFGALEPQVQAYAEVYRAWREVYRQLSEADLDEAEKARRIDLLEYQIREIEEADLRPGEQDELLAKRDLYRNAEKVASFIAEARELLSGGDEEDGAVAKAERAVTALNNASRYLEQAEPLSSQLQEALYGIQGVAEDLRSITDLLEFDPRELDETENRLQQLRRLTAKYGADERAVLSYLDTCRRELRDIQLSDERIHALTVQEQQLREQVEVAAAALTEKRTAAARRFAASVQEQLTFLDMPHVTMIIDRQPTEPGITGADRVEFLMSANVGEPPRPITRIASGGELSRIMLAIKSVLADADEIDTLIFDEIDTGISGRAAQKVGLKLHDTAQTAVAGRQRQVLCVTHLAQIAARGDHHFLISKSVRNDRTYTEVTALEKEGRARELARIIGGEVTDATLQAANEMLA